MFRIITLVTLLAFCPLMTNITKHCAPLQTSWFHQIDEYAKLVAIGEPDFIELKGVTFAGDSPGSSGITMMNVP